MSNVIIVNEYEYVTGGPLKGGSQFPRGGGECSTLPPPKETLICVENTCIDLSVQYQDELPNSVADPGGIPESHGSPFCLAL